MKTRKGSELELIEEMTDHMSVLLSTSEGLKKVPAKSVGKVKTVNGKEPDENGNIEVEGVKSFNDLDDKPFYEEVIEKIFFQEKTVFFGNGAGDSFESKVFEPYEYTDGNGELEIGKEYLIRWNESEYRLVCFELNDRPTIGANVDILEPNGEFPFQISFNTEDRLLIISTTEMNASHTIEIIELETKVKTIDEKFLPDGYGYHGGDVLETVFEGDVTFNDEGLGDNTTLISLIEDDTYIAHFGDKEYECICKATTQEIDGVTVTILYIGNGIFFGQEDTGEPFAIAIVPTGQDESGNLIYAKVIANQEIVNATTSVKIEHCVKGAVKFDRELIPNAEETIFYCGTIYMTSDVGYALLYNDVECTTRTTRSELLEASKGVAKVKMIVSDMDFEVTTTGTVVDIKQSHDTYGVIQCAGITLFHPLYNKFYPCYTAEYPTE